MLDRNGRAKQLPKRMKPNTEMRVIAILLAHQLRGGPVTKESLYECLEAVDELAEFQEAWLRAKHGGEPVDEREALWLDGVAEALARRD